jgi:hypothetical protein
VSFGMGRLWCLGRKQIDIRVSIGFQLLFWPSGLEWGEDRQVLPIITGFGEAMDDDQLPHEITVAVVSVDEHLIELEALVGAGYWCGCASAYTVSENIATFAEALQRFAEGVDSQAEFVAGADNGIGLVAFRFYRVDRSGHVACHVRLASGKAPDDHRPEQVCRLSIEVAVEAWAAIQFARQLGEVARTQAGKASLRV